MIPRMWDSKNDTKAFAFFKFVFEVPLFLSARMASNSNAAWT
jgi:hypothetical protein